MIIFYKIILIIKFLSVGVFVSLVLFWKQKRIGFVLETEKKDKTKTLKKSRTDLTC